MKRVIYVFLLVSAFSKVSAQQNQLAKLTCKPQPIIDFSEKALPFYPKKNKLSLTAPLFVPQDIFVYSWAPLYDNWENDYFNYHTTFTYYPTSIYPEGLVKTRIIHNRNDELWRKDTFEYNNLGMKVAQTGFIANGSDWDNFYRKRISYNAYNDIIESITESFNNGWIIDATSSYQKEYTYDINGHMLDKINKVITNGSSWDTISRESYNYNPDGTMSDQFSYKYIGNGEWDTSTHFIFRYTNSQTPYLYEVESFTADFNTGFLTQNYLCKITWRNYQGEDLSWYQSHDNLKSVLIKSWDDATSTYIVYDSIGYIHPNEYGSYLKQYWHIGKDDDTLIEVETVLYDEYSNDTLDQAEVYDSDSKMLKLDRKTERIRNYNTDENLVELIERGYIYATSTMVNLKKINYANYIDLHADPTTGTQSEIYGKILNLYPNPSRGKSTIRFDLEVPSNISLNIINNIGQVISTPINNQFMSKGIHETFIDLPNAGFYFIQLKINNYITVLKLINID